jgi:hypothetical protein
MKTKMLIPVLLLAACGDNLHETDDQSSSADEASAPDPDPEARAIDGAIYIETITCNETIAKFEADARYVDDNAPALNVSCKWTFDDGTTASTCAGEHAFAVAGTHDFVLEVTDLSTGATDTVTQARFFQVPLALTLDVRGDDLSITYTATSNTGGVQVVFVSPDDLVIVDDPNYPRTTSGTVRVRAAGTYTVTYHVEDERGSSEICSGQVVKEITLVCNGGHVH